MRSARFLGALFLGTASLIGCGSGEDPEPPPAQRVILITCDTLRADHLGAYGCDRGMTPHLDRLAESSRVYDQGYSCAPLTGPSLSSLLTGKLPDQIGVAPGNRFLMPSQVFTLAEAVAEKGIATAAVVSNYVIRHQPGANGKVGVEQGFATYDDRMSEKELNRPAFERRAVDTSQAAIEWIDEALARGDSRFFLWVHYQDPHGPYTPDPDFKEAFDREPTGEQVLKIGRTHKSLGQLPAYQVLDVGQDAEPYKGRYDGEIATFDRGLGKLLTHLENEKLMDEALVIFSADHGESLGEHDYWFGHGETLHQELVRVPMMVRFPAGARAGHSDALTSHLDVFPTALQALGIDPGPTLGRSLLDEDPSEPRVALSSLGQRGAPGRMESISDGRWRLITRAGLPPELYDLETDPGETKNLATTHASELTRLRSAAGSMLEGSNNKPMRGVNRRMAEADEAAFDGLGYGGGDEDD